MNTVDLLFPVIGERLPTDHLYGLFAACSRLLPCLHDGAVRCAIAPITGRYVGKGELQLDHRHSRLRLRLSSADLARVLPLAGKGLEVLGRRIRLGVPQVEALHPAPSLIARTVAIKHAKEVDSFLSTARKQLDMLEVGGSLRVPEHLGKDGRPEPRRRVVRIKDRKIVGFTLLVEGLRPEESLRLQENGLGGRRRLGCGVFLPARVEDNGHGS